MSEKNPFEGGGNPALSFAVRDEYGNMRSAPVGTKYTGKVTEAPKVVQARDFDSGKPATWPDGNPKWSVVIGLEVDGEGRTLWCPKPSALFKAVQDSLTVNGKVNVINVGDTIAVELTGFGKAEQGKSPQKLYAVYHTPGNAFAKEEASAPASASPSEDELLAAKARAEKLASMSDEDKRTLGLL